MEQLQYIIQWDCFPSQFCRNMCTLMENQILVDMTIICNSYSLKVHKCVLAANSSYFKDHLQRDLSIDRIVINGITYKVLKSLVEFLYCGETAVLEEDMQELLAAAEFFQIKGINNIKSDKIDLEIEGSKDRFLPLKPPVFLSKNDKFKLIGKDSMSPDLMYNDKSVKIVLEDSSYSFENSRRHKGIKISPATHAALAKEEEASRLALEMLQKDLSNASNLFVLEDGCNQSTFQNDMNVQSLIIEHGNVKGLGLSGTLKATASVMDKADKPKCLNEFPPDLPILYKANDGSLVNVTNDVLKSLVESGSVQYQVINGDDNVADVQQYICNFPMDGGCPPKSASDKQCEFTQLVSNTVSPDFHESSINFSGGEVIEEIVPDNQISVASEVSFEEYIIEREKSMSYPSADGRLPADDSASLHSISDTIDGTPMKKRRGRPSKKRPDEFINIHDMDNKENLLFKPNSQPFSDTDDQKLVLQEQNDSVYMFSKKEHEACPKPDHFTD